MTLTTNRRPLAVSVVCPVRLLVNNFMFDQTTLSSAMYFSVSFDGSIVTIQCGQEHTFPSNRERVLSGAHTNTEEGLERPKRLDRNVCSCLRYIVTIDPSKGTEKYITDDEAAQSNIYT